MLSLQHETSSQHVRTPEQIARDMGPAFVVCNGLVTHKSKVVDGKPKPTFDYAVPTAFPCETNFRHSHWKAKRAQVLAALASAGASAFELDRFTQCGSNCTVERSPSLKKLRLRACYCKNRHCEPCMRAKANKIAGNLRNRLEQEADGRYRFITLTLKHNTAPLRDQIKRLYASFKKMRGYAAWADTQRGGAVALEVKWKPETGRWHPHLHIISEGDFLHKRDLSNDWLKATTDSSIVDIRQLDSAKDAAHYVAKYVTKGTNGEVWQNADAAQEWITAMKGVRTVLTYGTWRGYKLLQVRQEATDWIPVTTLPNLYGAIERNEEWAMALMKQLEEKRLAREKAAPPQPGLFDP